MLICEKLVTAREDAAQLRQKSADLRKDAAHLHLHLHMGVTKALQAVSGDHLMMLQQVNARLVIATIEPRKSSWDDESPLSACGTTEFSAMQLYSFGTAPQMPKNC